MDWLRSCYSTTMVFRTGDTPIAVQWYFADEGAQPHPLMHSFGSTNWVNRRSEAGAIGEQPGSKPWRDGSKPENGGTGQGYAAACALTNPAYWQTGIPPGVETGPYNEQGLPVCCVSGPPMPPIEQCGCTTGQLLKLTIHAPANSCIDGQEFTLSWKEVDGEWNNFGEEPQVCGDCFLELRWRCINAFPVQWFLLARFLPEPGGTQGGCAGFSAQVDFTQCLPITGHSIGVWNPDGGPCDCTNSIVADSPTFDLVEL